MTLSQAITSFAWVAITLRMNDSSYPYKTTFAKRVSELAFIDGELGLHYTETSSLRGGTQSHVNFYIDNFLFQMTSATSLSIYSQYEMQAQGGSTITLKTNGSADYKITKVEAWR